MIHQEHIKIDIDQLKGGSRNVDDHPSHDINTNTNTDCDKSQANKLANRSDEPKEQEDEEQQQQQRPAMFYEQEQIAQNRSYNNDNDNSTIIILNDSQFPRHEFNTITSSAAAGVAINTGRSINKRCKLCFSFIKRVPVLLTVTLLLWSYYAFVFYFCFYYVQSIFERLMYLCIYHLLLMLLTWSFCRTLFTEIPKVPQEFVLPLETLTRLNDVNSEIERKHILENFAQTLPTVNRTSSGSVRYCAFCNIVKPDRAHHCRMCGYCILKMDHHCPWVNTCVCYYNYKYFLLYIGYALVYCIFIMSVTLKYFLEQWDELSKLRSSANIHVVPLFLLSFALVISLFSLFSYHCYLVLKNRTTLEAFRTPIFIGGPNKNGFNLGRFENFKEVFGNQPKYWFLPICTLSNSSGCSFPQSSDNNQKYLLVQTSDSSPNSD